MAANYSVWLLDQYGNRQSLIPFDQLEYALVLNGYGVLTLEAPAALVDYGWLMRDARLAIWREPAGRNAYLEGETTWLVRSTERAYGGNGERLVRVRAVGATQLLERRFVAYAAGSSQASKSGKADDVMKAIVRENLGSSATDSARRWNTLIGIDADAGAGSGTISMDFSRRNVLDVLRDMADWSKSTAVPIYFAMTGTETTLNFQTFPGQRGIDKRAGTSNPVIFSAEFGNLANAALVEDWTGERTFIYAAGQGAGTQRVEKTASDASRILMSPFGRIEQVIDCRNVSLDASVQAEATAALYAFKPIRRIDGTIQETPQARYGIEWNHGDQVTVEFDGVQMDAIISTVQVWVQGETETITARIRE